MKKLSIIPTLRPERVYNESANFNGRLLQKGAGWMIRSNYVRKRYDENPIGSNRRCQIKF